MSTLSDDFSMLNITFIDPEGSILCGVLTKFLQFMDDPKLVFTLVGFSYGVQPTEVMKALPWGAFSPKFSAPLVPKLLIWSEKATSKWYALLYHHGEHATGDVVICITCCEFSQ